MRARTGWLCLGTALFVVSARALPLRVELPVSSPPYSPGVVAPARPVPNPGISLAPAPAFDPPEGSIIPAAEPPADVPTAADAASAAAAAAADYFDGQVEPLPLEEILPLLSVGYRPDLEFRRWTAPGGANFLLKSEVNANRAAGRAGRLNRTLLRLAVPEEGAAILTEKNRDVIPREVARELRRNDNRPGPVILRRLASLVRRRLAALVKAPPAAVAPLSDVNERRLGDAIRSAWLNRMKQTREGRSLLSSLPSEDALLPLPAIRVVRMLGLAGGVQTIYGNQILISLEDLRRRLTEKIPPERREEFIREFRDETSAALYVDAHPELAVAAAEAIQTTLYHEHIHHWQSVTRALQTYNSRMLIPTITTVEVEYEAIFRQSLLIAELLNSDAAKITIDRLGEFVDLISDVARWRRNIEKSYLMENAHLYVTLPRLRELHEYMLDLANRLGRTMSEPIVAYNLEQMREGRRVLAAEAQAAEALQRRMDAELPLLATQGLVRWAALNEREARWIEAASAYHHLAEKSVGDEVHGWSARREEALARAWSKLIDGNGRLHEREPLDRRIHQINALASFFNRTNRPWPFQLWEARRHDFPLYAAMLRAHAEKSDPAETVRIHYEADTYEGLAKGDVATLRRYADFQMGILTSNPERARRDAAFKAGLRFASIIGDDDLIRAFNERKPVGLLK